MYNLLRFIKLNQSLILFLIIEGFSIFLLISNNRFQNNKFILFSNQYVSKIYSYSNVFSNYLYLKEKNKYLSTENAKLYSILNKQDLVNASNLKLNNTFLHESAKVVNNSINKRNNYLTLNKGGKHGIQKGMGVITQNGVIGIIQSVSNNYSVAMSMLHRKSAIGIKLKKNNHNGILTWKGFNYKQGNITNFPNHIMIKKGDTIITNMHSMIFPEGINIGSVLSFVKDDEGYYNVTIELFEDFNQLDFVYIVHSNKSLEKNNLEKYIFNE